MLDWLIIGGGVQGTALSFSLLRRHRLQPSQVRVLDPHEHPLALWRATTRNTGMVYLRSPEVHHLHVDPWSIRTFAQTQHGKPLADYIPLYNRPALALFRAYSDWLIERYGLCDLRLRGRAVGLRRLQDGWQVETDRGAITARRVVLALNNTEYPYWPPWARDLPDAPVQHIFQPGFIREHLPPWEHAVVIGGGISAAQAATTMANDNPGSVTLLMRHPIRIAHFDSDPCWVTPICLRDFHREPDFDKRRALVKQARQRGSVPPDVAENLRAAESNGRLRVLRGEVTSADSDGGTVNLHLASGDALHSDRVILATGFVNRRPGGAWLDEAITTYDLPVAACGFPIVDQKLRWGPGLHVVGRLAELEIGPVAGNIIGARLAGARLSG